MVRGDESLTLDHFSLSRGERLRKKRGVSRKKPVEEMEERGERGNDVREEDDDSTLKPIKVFARKRGRKPQKKTKDEEVLEDEEQGERKGAGEKDEILLDLPLNQLIKTSMELEPRERGRRRKRPAEDHGEEPQGELTVALSEGISTPEVAFLSDSRRITRSLKAYLDQSAARSALFNSPILNVKNDPAEIHDHWTTVNDISASKSSLDHAKDLGISSPQPAFASESRCLTRNMKAYLDRSQARSAPLKAPTRNVMTTAADEYDRPTKRSAITAAKPSSNHIKSQEILQFMQAVTFSPEGLPSGTDILKASVLTSGGHAVSTDHGMLVTDEHADLLAQDHASRDVPQANARAPESTIDYHLPAEEVQMPSNATAKKHKETGSKSNQIGTQASRSVTFNLTQMCSFMDDDFDEVGSRLDEALVSVNGYQVKSELAPILRDIFFRHGDIAKNSTFLATKSRSCLLENVCRIYKKLEGANFMLIAPTELDSLLEEVKDLETAKIDLRWLHCRIDEILQAKSVFKGLKQEKTRIIQDAERRRQLLEGFNKELEDCKRALEALMNKIHEEENALAMTEAEEEKLNEKFINMKSTLRGFYQKSLVHGLL